jgi:hypothetical protein
MVSSQKGNDYLTITVHCPVRAVGREIRNSFGVMIASAIFPDEADALATLINLGAAQMKTANHIKIAGRKK